MKPSHNKPYLGIWFGSILILWLAFLLRVWGLDFGLPFRFHPDEVQYADAALKWYTNGELRLHFVNPPLLVYILVSAYWPWIALNPIANSETWVTQAVAFARLWSVSFGMLTVALVYAVGKRLHSRKSGLVAMILIAGLFLPARESHFAVNDTLATFLVLLTIYLSVGLFQRRQLIDYVIVGIAVGLATASKLTAGLVFVAPVAAHFFVQPTLKLKAHIQLIVSLAIAALTFLIISLPLFVNPSSFLEDVIKHLDFGAEGYKGAQMAPATGWQFYLGVLGWGMGWLLLVVTVAALVGVIMRRSRMGIVVALFPVLFFVYMGAQKILFARFILPIVPPLVALAGVQLVIWQGRWQFWRRRPIMVWSVIFILLLAQPLAYLVWFNHLLTLPDTREIATEWFEDQFPENTIITNESYGLFPKLHVLNREIPYNVMSINERSATNNNLDHYLSRTTQVIVLSNYTFDRSRLEAADETLRLAQLDYLNENADLIKEFNPYQSDYGGWFYQDQIYGPAGETLQRLRPGPLIRVYQPHRPQLENLTISYPVAANFADQVHFLGYDLPQTQVKAGEALPITLYWQAPADRSPEADFTQFNHLLDENGALRGGYERRPNEYYDTSLWQAGEIVIDGYVVPVDADAPPGLYYLNVGYYVTVGESAVNLPLMEDGQMTEITSISIGPIEVIAP